MSAARYTPGPWRCAANGGDDDDTRALLVGTNDRHGDFTVIADCRSRWIGDEVGGDEEANARLIAAAPDIHKALIAASHALKSYTYGNAATDLAKGIAEMCDAAIAKAEGRS